MLKLWYRTPAKRFEEALPIGNGRLGAMVYGEPAAERLSLNEDTFWTGSPYDPVNPAASSALDEVRKLIFARRFAEAQALSEEKLIATPRRQQMYQPIGDLRFSMPVSDGVTNYRRELDLATALSRVQFEHGGVRFERCSYASAVDGVIVLTASADRAGALSASLRLDSKMPSQCHATAIDELLLAGTNTSAEGIPGGLRFACRVRAIARGGRVSAAEGSLTIAGADSVELLIAIATSYRSMTDTDGDPIALTRATLDHAAQKSTEQRIADHIADYRRLFDRVTIALGSTAAAEMPTDLRVQNAVQKDDPALAALYFQYGRYLLISSSRPGSQPANLQGIWNEETSPPWGSKWTVNINTQMNYWPAETTALPELAEPLFKLIEDVSITGRHTAQTMYRAGGWVLHHNTDLWRATAPVDGAPWGMWPTGGAWLCEHLWEHYVFNPNPEFLARAYPLMKGASQFFVDTLVTDPHTGRLVTCPTLSPENAHHAGVSLAAGATMDAQILRDLLRHTSQAARLLNCDADFAESLAALIDRLPPNRIGNHGQLQEWQDDWDADAPEQDHRHISHLYGLFPSNQIDARLTPDLADAARVTLNTRGDRTTGWAIAWRLNCWARLNDGDRAHAILQALLDPTRTYPNLFDAHPPFQIDGNFGGTSGIAEMLLQSHAGEIHLLPALPTAWPTGQVSGLRARGGYTIDVAWSGGRLASAGITAKAEGPVVIHYRNATRQFHLRAGERLRLGHDLSFSLASDGTNAVA